MTGMGEMEMACNEIIDMIAVRNRLMSTGSAVTMVCFMPVTVVGWCAGRWILGSDFKAMFIYMVVMKMMEVPVMQIIRVAVMHNSLVSAPYSVLMVMLIVNGMIVHGGTPFWKEVRATH